MTDSGEPISKRLRQRKDPSTPQPSTSAATKSPAQKSPATSRTKSPPPKSMVGTESVPPQENVSSNSLLYLTDICLLLFERLDIESLSLMPNVCKRFGPIAERAFSERHKEFVFKGRACKNSVFRRVLCKFGHLITKIDASEAYFDGNATLDVNAIVKYCINTLEDLSLYRAKIDCDVAKPLFSRLKILDLHRCILIGNKKSRNSLLANCSKLEYLAFKHEFFDHETLMDRPIGFIIKHFPKLKTVVFDCSYVGFAAFFELLAINPQLKTLEVLAYPEDIYIDSIVAYAENVEALAIHGESSLSKCPETQTRKYFLQLSKLKKLRRLFLEAGYEIYGKLVVPLMDAFAKNNVPIFDLKLRDFFIGAKEINSILKLKTIKFLHLHEIGNVTDADLVPLTKELPLLENVQLYFGSKAKTPITVNGLIKLVKAGKQLDYLALVDVKNLKIDKKAFDGLLKAAQTRGNENKLRIDIFGDKKTNSFNIPDNEQQAGKQHLKVNYTVE